MTASAMPKYSTPNRTRVGTTSLAWLERLILEGARLLDFELAAAGRALERQRVFATFDHRGVVAVALGARRDHEAILPEVTRHPLTVLGLRHRRVRLPQVLCDAAQVRRLRLEQRLPQIADLFQPRRQRRDREIASIDPAVHFRPAERRRCAGILAGACAVSASQRLALDVLQVVHVDLR